MPNNKIVRLMFLSTDTDIKHIKSAETKDFEIWDFSPTLHTLRTKWPFFFRNRHENEEILAQKGGGGGRVPCAPS